MRAREQKGEEGIMPKAGFDLGLIQWLLLTRVSQVLHQKVNNLSPENERD